MGIMTTDGGMDRRRWFHATAAAFMGAGASRGASAASQEPTPTTPAPPVVRNVEPEEVERDIRDAGLGEPRRLRSNHYLEIGRAHV